eukprot:8734195-Pyramimonas_sp.AAC.1
MIQVACPTTISRTRPGAAAQKLFDGQPQPPDALGGDPNGVPTPVEREAHEVGPVHRPVGLLMD